MPINLSKNGTGTAYTIESVTECSICGVPVPFAQKATATATKTVTKVNAGRRSAQFVTPGTLEWTLTIEIEAHSLRDLQSVFPGIMDTLRGEVLVICAPPGEPIKSIRGQVNGLTSLPWDLGTDAMIHTLEFVTLGIPEFDGHPVAFDFPV